MEAFKVTIHRIIQRYEEEGFDKKRKIGTGRKAEKLPPAKVKRLIKRFCAKEKKFP